VLSNLSTQSRQETPGRKGRNPLSYAPRAPSSARRGLEETLESIARIVPAFDRATVVDDRVFREPFAQSVCPVGFTSRLGPPRTPLPNLVAADTAHLLPHDRSISHSLALAQKLLGAFREAMAPSGG